MSKLDAFLEIVGPMELTPRLAKMSGKTQKGSGLRSLPSNGLRMSSGIIEVGNRLTIQHDNGNVILVVIMKVA